MLGPNSKSSTKSHDALEVLLVDDDKNIRQTLLVSLRTMGCEVKVAATVEEATQHLAQHVFDFVLTDYKLVEKTGLEVVQFCQSLNPRPVVVVMTAYAAFDNAVLAIKGGAFDYLPKPFSNAQLSHLLSKIKTLVDLKRENHALKLKSGGDFFSGMMSPAMLRLKDQVFKIAKTESSVLIAGESGTGKSHLARVLHEHSARSSDDLVVVNSPATAEAFFVAPLGLNNATVFFDEIADLSAPAQLKLLDLLEHRDSQNGIRVFAATHRTLPELVEDGKFRRDLFYRLNEFEFFLVPLRHRREDLPVLIERFLLEFSRSHLTSLNLDLPPALMARLTAYSWPGNIRELRNVLERLVILSHDGVIAESHLPQSISASGTPHALMSLAELERRHIERVLAVEKNQERAADILGITAVTLWRRRKEYGLS